MTKSIFIQSYIDKLEEALKPLELPFEFDEAEEAEFEDELLIDLIIEISSIFETEIPNLKNQLFMKKGCAERDANILIGILKLHITNQNIENSEIKNNYLETIFNELKIEYNGLRDTVFSITSAGNIKNYFEKLEQAINDKKLYSIKYCLNQIEQWYSEKIDEIVNTPLISNKEQHQKNRLKISTFKEEFSKYDSFPEEQLEITESKQSTEPLIFLSHKSDDKNYGDLIAEFLTKLGVKRNQLIYSSHELHKIPLGKNIFEYLRENINSNIFMIILWSDEYLESPACLNEMGAAWVVQCDYTNMYVPSFQFGNPKYHECAVDTRKMGAVLNGDKNCKANLFEFKNKIQKMFNLENDEKNSMFIIDNLISDLKILIDLDKEKND